MDENEQVKKPENAIVYVRLSDTLDDAAGRLSLADQEARARKRGADLGWGMQAETVIENDLTGSGMRSLASAYKTKKVVHPDGRVTFEDRRPRWREVLASLCTGEADGLVVLDLDRALRQMRSAADLLDMNRASGAPVESATGSLRLYGNDLVAQLVRSLGPYGRVAVPALRYPGAQPEAVDQVGIAPVPTQVVQCF